MSLKPKVGGIYKNNKGNIVLIYSEDVNDPVFKFHGRLPELSKNESYTENGHNKTSDLIEEVYYSEELRDSIIECHNVKSIELIFENEVKLCK